MLGKTGFTNVTTTVVGAGSVTSPLNAIDGDTATSCQIIAPHGNGSSGSAGSLWLTLAVPYTRTIDGIKLKIIRSYNNTFTNGGPQNYYNIDLWGGPLVGGVPQGAHLATIETDATLGGSKALGVFSYDLLAILGAGHNLQNLLVQINGNSAVNSTAGGQCTVNVYEAWIEYSGA